MIFEFVHTKKGRAYRSAFLISFSLSVISNGFTRNNLYQVSSFKFLTVFRFAFENPFLVVALKFGRPLMEIAN